MDTATIIILVVAVVIIMAMFFYFTRQISQLTEKMSEKVDKENRRTQDKIDQIKQLVREGKTVKEIAEKVGVSDPTVRKYKAEVANETTEPIAEGDQED